MPIGSILLAVLSLGAVVGLVVLAGRAARTGGDRLALVQTIALDPRRRVHLVRCDDRHVVLLTGPGQDVVAGWLEPAARRDAP
jgi:hypothetical protein